MNMMRDDMRDRSRNESPDTVPRLKPCPFCGCTSPMYDLSMALVHCPDCGVAIEYRYNRGVPPIAAWNQRERR